MTMQVDKARLDETAEHHAIDLEQCALFVDSAPLRKSMTDAAAFLRSLRSTEGKEAIYDLEASVSALEEERQNLIATKCEQIKRLERERDAAMKAEDEANDCFWSIYADYLKMGGKAISTEAGRSRRGPCGQASPPIPQRR